MSGGHFKTIDLQTLAHRRVEADRALRHGDVIEREGSVMVFLDHESELEGLERVIDDGQLELTWKAGEIDRAVRRVYRFDPGERPLERLLTLPVARSLTTLVIDLVGFDDWPAGVNEPIQVEASNILDMLGHALPSLTDVSFTHSTEPQPPTVLLERALANLKARRPKLKTSLTGLIRQCSKTWFDRDGERIPLENGWTLPGVLAVETRGWLTPHSASLRLNGHRVRKTLRLLEGDVLTNDEGLHLAFAIE